MLSWQVGAVKITRVVESQSVVAHETLPYFLPAATPAALAEIPWLAPHFVDEEGRLITSIHALLVETPDLRLVVDTCMGTERPEDSAPGEIATAAFLQALAEAGWSRDSVDFVLCTHLHLDHVGWNTFRENGRWVPTFPNARYLFSAAEYAHWSKVEEHGVPQVMAASIQPILEAGLADMVGLDHRIAPEVRLVPSLGHTPGHVSVAIESQGERAMITGDMAHHPCQFARPHWSTMFDTDAAQAVETRRRLFADWADEPVLVIGTHFAGPSAGQVKQDGEAYRFET